MPTTYHLPPHVFSCLTGRYCVFLDLERDRYFSVPRDAMVELAPWVDGRGLPTCSRPPADARPSEAADELASELLAAGALIEGGIDMARAANVTPAPDLDFESMEWPEGRNGRILFGLPSVALALLQAEWTLRTAPIARIVEAVRKSKSARSAGNSEDCDRAAQVAMTFLRYRPLFPRNFRCLFDSLALIRFLSRFHLYPDWVFGVQDDPFSAHCWVQAGGRVLNDHLDRVSSYTPIMVV